MAQDANLKQVLDDLHDALADLSMSELMALAEHWDALKTYSEDSSAQRTQFINELIDLIQQSPTLIKHGFLDVLIPSNRFLDQPAPNQNQLLTTQGLPPVHNEIVRIAQKIAELVAQSRLKD